MRRYIPSNGTEGDRFESEFCSNCVNEKFMHTNNHDDKQCGILDNAILNDRPCLDSELKFDGWEWFRDEDTVKCNQYKYWDWDINDGKEPPEEPPHDPNQLLLFSFDSEIDELLKVSERETEKV